MCKNSPKYFYVAVVDILDLICKQNYPLFLPTKQIHKIYFVDAAPGGILESSHSEGQFALFNSNNPQVLYTCYVQQ